MPQADEFLRELLTAKDGNVAAVADELAKNDIKVLPIHYPYAIGHLSLEMDCYLKDVVLNRAPNRPTILLAPKDQVANYDFLQYYEPYFVMVTDPELCAIFAPLKSDARLIVPMEHYVMPDHCAAEVYRIYDLWQPREPLIGLDESTQQKGLDWLHAQGMPKGRWLALFHARECGNRPQDFAHKHRNVDIETYIPAMQYVLDNGGWCVRMGDKMMKSFSEMPGVIDYAHHLSRHGWLDVFLCGQAKFLIGCTSGMAAICSVLGTPVAMTNLTPISGLPIGPEDVGIPRLLWSEQEKRLLTFKEIFDSPFSNARAWTQHFAEWEQQGIRHLPNTPEDILDVTIEMHERDAGRASYSLEDEILQRSFKALMNEQQHYGYFTSARVGRNFLRKYRHLLPEQCGTEERLSA